MLIDTAHARLHLEPGRVAHITLAPRARLTGVTGQAWITIDNDIRDIVLGPGDAYIADATVHALACALHGAAQAELLVTEGLA